MNNKLPSITTIHTLTLRGHASQSIRIVYVMWTLLSFMIYVFLDYKGWLYLTKKEKVRDEKLQNQAKKLRKRLIKLGPTFIKIGQALGTRADLLPIAYIDELAKLQNQVPSFPSSEAFSIIESELGKPINEIFDKIEATPIAAASLGQVYRAYLHEGNQEVAVKVQRPNLEKKVALDLDILRRLAKFLARYPSLFKGHDWPGMIEEFDRVIHEEMDYKREGYNAEYFKKNFASWPNIYIPRIYWDYSTSRVLTMEFLKGTQVNDKKALAAAQINSQVINELMTHAYFKQLLEDGFFHADPHPGNLLILADGRLAFLDFGMVGNISVELQNQMVQSFFHILNRDYRGIVQDLINLKFLSPEVDLQEFSKVVEDLFRRKLDIKLSEVRFKDLTYELGEIIYTYPLTTPATFTFIMRALMTLEGISIQMNPDFKFMEVAKPYARNFLFRQESSHLRKQIWESLYEAKTGQFSFGKLFELVRSAITLYFT